MKNIQTMSHLAKSQPLLKEDKTRLQTDESDFSDMMVTQTLRNHPSGGTEPSNDDLEITNRLCKAGAILGINVLDHLIITSNDYFSFKQKGLI